MARVEGLAASAGARTREPWTIALIATGHFASHFYILVLPPLFPVLSQELGVGYAELGLALAVLNGTTAIFQAPIGFLVDRHGPLAILLAGQTLFALATAAIGLFASYAALLLCCALAGLGNAVYHPADYAILGARVSAARMGRAFSIHTFGGYLGFAAAPVVVVGLNEVLGWQLALLAVGLAGLGISVALFICRAALFVPPARASQASGVSAGLALLISRPLLLAFAFFTLFALAQSGINGFTVASLEAIYGFDLLTANLPLTVFLIATTAGVLLGGVIADRTRRHAEVVGICFLLLAGFGLTVATLALTYWLLLVFFALAGLAAGAIAPSRDMLVRALTPQGASGKVFGFVTSGFNLAGMLAPPLFGAIIDVGWPAMVYGLVALLSLLNLPLVLAAGRPSPKS